ncbi:MAG TPA: hypothetical protein VE983_12855 [Solirubrobacteraceae bacterium]|nr:hypothetical protein [Solirubrobacteraceae bacterium]
MSQRVEEGAQARRAVRRGPNTGRPLPWRPGFGALALAITFGLGASPAFAGASSSSVPPGLRTQAHRLYEPVREYERSTTPAERAKSGSEGARVGKKIDACDRPYRKKLTQPKSQQGMELYMLWNNATLLQTYQGDVKPVAAQLATLAGSWAELSLRNRVMNRFVHAMATEFHATLHAVPFDSCKFVRAIAAHHFSYTWARHSTYGQQALAWWRRMAGAGDGANSFWRYVYPNGVGGSSSEPGAHLFTKSQLSVLANLPGELG